MKTIVCYGDSNTWGFIPMKKQPAPYGARFGPDIRWPGVLQTRLGPDYRVEEEGLSGRTTVFDDPMDGRRNGLRSLDYCLFTNSPIDLLIIMLGSNDIKEHLGQTPFSIACGLEQLIVKAKNGQYGPEGGSPGILVISPPRLRDNLDGVWPGAEFGKGHREKDEQLKWQYMRVAEKHGCHFLCAADYAKTSKNDGVHMDAENHAKLAGAVYETVREIFTAY